MIPYGRQEIMQSDIDAVVEVLKSDYITQGPVVPIFERKLSKLVGSSNSVAANSATSCLHIACKALGLGVGDYLWTSPLTFVASANCALYCGASIDFVDIEPDTGNMCADQLENKLKAAEKIGKLPKIVTPVHFGGQSCDMLKIDNLSKKYGFRVIEDASHAIGGCYNDSIIGGCKYSDITVFSFHPVKIITTGEGGVATTNQENLIEKMRLLRSHGITREVDKMIGACEGPWYYEQIDLGYNYRMTDIQAALGVSQLERLSDNIRARHSLSAYYSELLLNMPVRSLYQKPNNYSSMHIYVIKLKLSEINKKRDQIFKILRSAGVGVNVHYIPVHLHPYYQALGFKHGDYPEAESFYSAAITLPLYPSLLRSQQELIVDVLSQAVT